ncbi:hypothetical protein L6R50_07700 [Myxococcota bacterium]|nr:hypothetical protein [Myxococcota bacterium]
MRNAPLALVAVAGLSGASGTARANPPDLFGLGAPAMGRGGGGIAISDDAMSAYLNPAGLGRVHRGMVQAGLHLGWERFGALPQIASDGNRDGYVNPDSPYDRWVPEDYPQPSGLHFGAAKAALRYLRGGIAVGLPMERIVLLSQEDPQYPYYVRWKNRPQRFSVTAAGAVVPVEGLSFGGGVTVLARAALRLAFVIDADLTPALDEEGRTEGIDLDFVVNPNDIEVDVRPVLAPVLGFQWDLGTVAPVLKGLAVGGVFRGPIDLEISPTELDLDLYFRVHDIGDLGEISIPLEAQVLFQILDFYTPMQVGFGVGYVHPRVRAYADVQWNRWSKALPSVARVDEEGTTVHIGVVDLDPEATNTRDYDPLGWRDTFSFRAGAELRPKSFPVKGRLEEIGLVFRAGYGYDPTYVPEQTGLTNFLDSDVHAVTAGIGAWTRDPFQVLEGPVSLDLSFQYHHLVPRTNVKDPSVTEDGVPAGYPLGGEITSSGRVVTVGATVGFDY